MICALILSFDFFEAIKDFKQQVKNLKSRVQLVSQKVTTNEEKQLEVESQLKSHGHGNRERIDDLLSKLDVLLIWKNNTDRDHSVKLSKRIPIFIILMG